MEPKGTYVRTGPISEIPQEDKAQVSRVSKPIFFFMVFALLPYKTIEIRKTAKRFTKKEDCLNNPLPIPYKISD
jgi:hypothetical protein